MDNYSFYMKTNLEKYLGEWVAIVDEKLVSHGKSAKDVYREAKEKYPDKTPFLTCVPKKLR